MGKSALYLWCAGLAIVTFDLVLTIEIGGFTVKSYYLLFLAAASLWLLTQIRAGQAWAKAGEILRAPWVFAFLLFVYELGMAPFSFTPKKSFFYSLWLLFDLTVVAIPGYFLLREETRARRLLPFTLIFSSVLIGTILLIDLVAFQYGYQGGLIGFNQEISLKWGMSRAHAFSFEPSYLAMFLSFSLLFLLAHLLSPTRFNSSAALGMACFFLLISILLLGSRTGWVMTSVGVVALGLRFYRALLVRKWLVAGLGALVVAFLFFLPPQHLTLMAKNLVATVQAGTDGSGNTRLDAMKEALNIGAESRGLGVGVGASFLYYLHGHPEAIRPGLYISQGGEYIMSIWGQLVAESGVPGTLLYLGFALSLIFFAFRAARSGVVAFASAVSAVLFFAFTAHFVGNVARTDVWVWFAIWLAATRAEKVVVG